MNVYLNENPEHISTFGSGGMSELIPESDTRPVLEERRKQFNIKYKNITLYLLMSVVGTVLWSYAGFLNKFISC